MEHHLAFTLEKTHSRKYQLPTTAPHSTPNSFQTHIQTMTIILIFGPDSPVLIPKKVS